jgi:hypothetical protein
LRRLVSLLLAGCRHDSSNVSRADLKSVGQMLSYLWRKRSCRQQFGERPVTVADLTIAEAADKLAPTHPEGLGALQDEPAYRAGTEKPSGHRGV